MKVSYLIIAHHNLLHLERLIDQLNDGNSNIYIHLDARQPVPPHLQQKPNVFFLEDRINVYWCGYTFCEVTIKLMERAVKDGSDYFALISGADFPLRKNEELLKQLEEGGEFINLLPIEGVKPLWRYVYYHFERFNRRKYWYPKTLVYCGVEYLVRFVRPKKKVPFPLYVGSNWCVLSKNCIEYILQVYKTDKRYEKFFRGTFVPDEALFHTIIGNSPFLKDVKHNLTYTDWNARYPPAVITEQHVELLKINDTFTGIYGTFRPHFARKFNDACGKVVEKIQEELINR